MNQIGYFAVIVPERHFWQGYFIDSAWREPADKLLARMRSDVVFRKTEVITKLPIPDEDQPLVGSCCAALVEAALGRTERNDELLGTAGFALHLLTKRPFFVVEGKLQPAGTQTHFTPIWAASIDQARDLILDLPVVRKIKRYLLSQVRDGQHRSTAVH